MIKPLRNQVLVKVDEIATMSEGGIALPDTVRENAMEGEVVSVGPGATDIWGQLIPVAVNPGEHVMFAKFAGTKLEEKGETFLLLNERELLTAYTDDSFRVLNDWVMIRRHEVETKLIMTIDGLPSMLHAPENRIEKNIRCTVVGSGPGETINNVRVPTGVKAGDVVILRQWEGCEIDTFNDRQLLMVKSAKVEAVDEDATPDPVAMVMIDAQK